VPIETKRNYNNIMINRWFATVAVASVISLGLNNGLAQQDNNNNQGGGGRRGGGNFDPAQFQQRMMERTRENLEVKDDTEWKALEPLVQKVMDARMANFSGRGFGGRRGGGGGGGDQGGGGGGRRGGFGGQPSAEAEALNRAIEGKASNAELKAALAKYVESRKAKQAELEKAQADLRKVLSLRQEAIATADGLL
jgi:hypothetical protein